MKGMELSVAAMKKQKAKYEEALQCPAAYEVALNSVSMRNALVKSGVPFVDLPGNVFLPFMGIVLQDVYLKQLVKADKMMPATQMVFLELLYMENEESVLKSEVANKLNLTKTSITRATAQLEGMGLIRPMKSGTEIAIKRNYTRKEYYENAKAYLINPVQKEITIMRCEATFESFSAGETALSQESELNPPRIEERAIYKGEEVVDQLEIVDARSEEPDDCLKVQLWKYNPSYFATLRFVQECLIRFGNPGDSFKLVYREKENAQEEATVVEEVKPAEFNGYLNPYSTMLVESKNIIFRGAPGTGKTYLAKEIATDIISNGYFDDYTMLTDEQKQQVEFVQFHPSYDYSDFVEGLRPKTNEDGSMGFELQDGVFKKFVDKARRNYENSKKSTEVIANELSVQEAMKEFFDDVDTGNNTFKTKTGTEFTITDVDDEHIYLSIPQNASINSIRLNISEIRQMLESGREFNKLKDITEFFNINFTQQRYSYNLVIFNEIQKKKKTAKIIRQEELKKYVFIIDEINRGEISKIFGELFFAVNPGYRGVAGEVSTQYANLHADCNEKFYIPDNVYIIGTMNDIDRSVDSFDFAMRRRFRFVELRADERLEMLANLNNEEKESEAIARMSALNVEIVATEGLNENY